MKPLTLARLRTFLNLLMLGVLTGMLSPIAGRAGLVIQLNLSHFNANGSNYYYTISEGLSTNIGGANSPYGDYFVVSPGYPTNNGTSSLFHYTTTNGFVGDSGGSSFYGDFNSAMQGMTNGFWKIYITNGASTLVYSFKVTAPTLVSNALPNVYVTFPLLDATNSGTTPTFTWVGPSNYSSLQVTEHNSSYSFYISDALPVTATSWTTTQSLPYGSYDFSPAYTSNTTLLTASTPTNGAGAAIGAWTSTAILSTSFDTDFSLPTPAPSTNHTLVAHYTFDDTNNIGADSSGNGIDMNFGGAFGGGGVSPSTDAIAGGGAELFTVTNQTQGGFVGWDPTPSVLLQTLAGSFSISIWVKNTDSYGNQGDEGYNGAGIVSADVSGQANDLVPIALTGGQVAFTTGGDSDDVLNSQNLVDDGNYHHIVVTRNQLTGEKKIYIDGNLDSTDIATTNFLNDPQLITVGSISDAGQSDPATTSYYNGYAGVIDDLQIYNGVLSADDVELLYLNPGQSATNVTTFVDLATAVNYTNSVWYTSGDSSWVGQTGYSHDGMAAAQSGIVTNNQISTLETTITGPATVSFYWTTVAPNSGSEFEMDFFIDGNYYDYVYGNPGWLQETDVAIPAGTHTLIWNAYAEGDNDPTEFAYVDQFTVSASAPIVVSNPSNAVAYAGTAAGFQVAATGTNVDTYSWQLGSTTVPGATNATLILTNVGSANAGTYTVTVANPAGSATASATLTVTNDAALPPFSIFQQAISAGGTNISSGQEIAVASNGDICVAGNFTGTNTFGTTTLTSTSNSLFVGRLTATGSWLWIKKFGAGTASANVIGFDPNGNLIVAGSYEGTAQFGAFTLTNAGNYDAFLARFDSNGNCTMAFRYGGPGGDFIQGLSFDPAGNIYVSGYADTSSGLFGTNTVAVGSPQGAIASYTSNGVLRWEISSTTTNSSATVFVDSVKYLAGALYAVGWNSDSFQLGATNLTKAQHMFMAKLSTNGAVQWVKAFGSTDQNFYPFNYFPQLAYNLTNTLTVAGSMPGTNALFPPLAAIPAEAGENAFLARFDTNGNFLAARVLGNTNTIVNGVATDAAGEEFVTGTFSGSADFGGRFLFNSRGPVYSGTDYAEFAAKYDPSGNLLWARGTENLTGSSGIEFSGGIAADTNGYAYLFAPVAGTVYFGSNSVASLPQSAVIARIGPNLAQLVTTLQARYTNGYLNLTFTSTAGHTNTIQYRTNLVAGSGWLTYTNFVGDGTLKSVLIPTATPPQEFFRISTQ